jgi:integrase/predicted RNA-binding Zn-ribbon protein involved in translation (DUF1610 family)
MDSGRKAGFTRESTLDKSGEKRTGGSQSINALPAQPPLRCPECGSQRTWRDGIRQTEDGPVQRYLCRLCGFRFSQSTVNLGVKSNVARQVVKQPDSGEDLSQTDILQVDLSIKPALKDLALQRRENVGSHSTSLVTIPEKGLNSFRVYNRERQVCVSEGEAKNLAEMQGKTQQNQAAGVTTPTDSTTLKGKIVEFAFWMQKQGYKESTMKTRIMRLQTLVKRGVDLLDPESFKKILAMQKTWSEGTKANAVDAYNLFLEKEEIKWNPPKYTRLETIPFIPSEAELNQLIGACGKKLGTFLQGLKETGADPGELASIVPSDISKEARAITINRPVKRHRPRILTVSAELIRRMEALTPNPDGKIFDEFQLRRTFYYKRKTTAHKMANPRLLKITFITFRHWFGTMEYHRTKDILHVQRLLGHKNIQNTLIYIDLECKLFNNINDNFTSRVAHNVGEACQLIEAGFEYVTGEYNDGGKIFRKRN